MLSIESIIRKKQNTHTPPTLSNTYIYNNSHKHTCNTHTRNHIMGNPIKIIPVPSPTYEHKHYANIEHPRPSPSPTSIINRTTAQQHLRPNMRIIQIQHQPRDRALEIHPVPTTPFIHTHTHRHIYPSIHPPGLPGRAAFASLYLTRAFNGRRGVCRCSTGSKTSRRIAHAPVGLQQSGKGGGGGRRTASFRRFWDRVQTNIHIHTHNAMWMDTTTSLCKMNGNI